MHQNKTTPQSSSEHDKAYWNRLWTRQERAIEQARTPTKRDNSREKWKWAEGD